jgi:uncharacterized membrane protein YkvA (DUF1232 family)
MSEPLRDHIAAVRGQPQAAAALRERIGQLPGVSTPGQIDQCEAAINGAIDSIPNIIEEMAAAGQQAGIGHLLAPILQRLTGYFLAVEDLLPERKGTLGLLDDAYLAHLYLQEINRAYQASTGMLLLAIDLSDTIAVLRVLLSPQVSDQLDQAVSQGVNQAIQLSQFQQLTEWNQSLSPTGGPGAWGGSWEDEMSRVGAEIGISIDW